MPIRLVCFLLASVLCWTSCAVVQEDPFWYDSGEATVRVNGALVPRADFVLYARPSSFSDGLDLYLEFPRLSPAGRDQLILMDIPREPGVYPLPRRDGAYLERVRESIDSTRVAALFTSGGDVLLAVYVYDLSAPNTLRVAAFDARTDGGQGAFAVTLVQERTSLENTPDTLRFEVPHFHTRIIPDDEWERRTRATGIVHG